MKIFPLLFLLLISFTAMSQDNTTSEDWAQLKKYAAQNKRLKAPVKNETRVVFMGNSITEFWKSDKDFFANPLYINRGISGQTTAQMLVRFKQDVIALKPALVIILGGINDIAQNQGPVTLQQTFNNLTAMAKLAKQHQIKVVLCSVLPAYEFPWRPGMQPAAKIIALNKMISSYCLKNKLGYIDYYSPMVDKRGGLKKELSEDGVHPNAKGYQVMEPLVEKAIRHSVGAKIHR